MKIINDFNIKKEAEELGISIWQAPSFLFLMMGIVSAVVMIVVYFVSKNYASPEFLIISEFVIVVIILVTGNMIITNMEKLAKINKMKSEFVAIVSHQLKNPLSAISWDIELLIAKYKNNLEQRQLDIIKKINYSNTVMSKLVGDLLDVARIDQGNLFVKNEKFNLEDVIKKVLIKNEPLTKTQNITIGVKSPEVIPPVIGDEKRVEVALDNLVSNAIKYNKKDGTVLIEIKKNKKDLVVCIKDTGIGISESEKERIFDRFYRSEDAIKKETGGTGLGLYIAKNIIEQCGGKMWFNSKKNKGSEFCFSIKLV